MMRLAQKTRLLPCRQKSQLVQRDVEQNNTYCGERGPFRPGGRELDQIRILLLVETYLLLFYISPVRLI